MISLQKMIYLAPAILLIALSQPSDVLAQKNAAPFLQEAQTAIEEGRYTEAEDLLNQTIAKHPDSAEAQYYLGLSLHQQLRLREAILAYRKAIEINPTYDLPYLNLGLAWIEGRRLDEASKIFRQVLTLPDRQGDPVSNHTLAHYNLAVIYNRQDQPEIAIKEIQAALAITPDFEPAKEFLETMQTPERPQ